MHCCWALYNWCVHSQLLGTVQLLCSPQLLSPAELLCSLTAARRCTVIFTNCCWALYTWYVHLLLLCAVKLLCSLTAVESCIAVMFIHWISLTQGKGRKWESIIGPGQRETLEIYHWSRGREILGIYHWSWGTGDTENLSLVQGKDRYWEYITGPGESERFEVYHWSLGRGEI